MKRFLLLITVFLVCGVAFAHTINWHVDGNIYQTTTCDSGESITPPTAPYKYGYHFVEWEQMKTPIEYLESTGTQYIDTGYIPNINSGMVIDVYSVRRDKPVFAVTQQLLTGSKYVAFGANAASNSLQRNFLVYNGDSNDQNGYWGAENIYGGGTGRYTITIDKQIFSIKASDNSVYTKTVTNVAYTLTQNLILFGLNRNGTITPTTTKIYSCKLYDNGTLVRDFIPVLDKDGVPCMYDKVTKQFFYNQGTGQFIAGPVVSE